MPFNAQQIDHVEVLVQDIAAAARWYRDVLGLEEIVRWNPEPVMIGAGGTKLALFRADGSERKDPGDAPHWHRTAWRTDASGFREAQEHLRSFGVSFTGPIDHGRAESIYFNDPDGNPLEITYYK